jgi:PAS domain S-box-containing protein
MARRSRRSPRPTERQLRQSEERYRQLFDRTPIGLYRSTPEGTVLDVNPALVQMLGYPDAATLRAAGAVALYVDPAERERHVVQGLAATPLLRAFEVRWRRFDGSVMWVRHNVRAVEGPGGEVVYEGAAEDITETRQMQEALLERTRALEAAQQQIARAERLAFLGKLAGGMSHELRNPLGVIKNAVYYLRTLAPPDDERVRKHLAIIEREVGTATKIVADLLDFARTAPPTRALTDVNGLVRDTLARAEVPPEVRVALQLAPAPPRARVDGAQVLLILGNLIRNALQAMLEGGTLSAETAAEGDEVTIAIADTGVGIAPEHLEQVFEPLFATRSRGIGLGLAVSQTLAEANGGRITVQSARGEGSRFTVRFPRAG